MHTLFKHVIKIAVICALLFSLSGCGEVKKAETSVNNMFKAFQNLNFEDARNYIDLNDIKVSNAEGGLTGNSELFMKTLFKKINHEIISSEKVDKNTVMVKTKISAVDMKPVMGEFFTVAMEYAFSKAFSDLQPSEEETNKKMEEMFITAATKPDLATVENEVDIRVVRDNKVWKIVADDVFTNALFGGLIDVAKDMEKSFANNAE